MSRDAVRQVRVPAAAGPAPTGPVGAVAFADPDAGWVSAGPPGSARLLRTPDAGISWTGQLAWAGGVVGPVSAFDRDAAVLVLSLGDGVVNGVPVGAGAAAAVTGDGGATWDLTPLPDAMRFTGVARFLDPLRWRLLMGVAGTQMYLAASDDGGVTWDNRPVPGQPFLDLALVTADDVLLLESVGPAGPGVHATHDGGSTWTRQPLPRPAGVPARARMLLTAVPPVGDTTLLVLRAGPGRDVENPPWAGLYAYLSADRGRTWSAPQRLPVEPDWIARDLVALGPDGDIWLASGSAAWTAGVAAGVPGRWRRLPPVPLPDRHVAGALAPVGRGVVWLASTRYPAPATPPSGILLRGDVRDAGVDWTEILVGATAGTG